jgi:hypothetical protein
MSGLPCRFFQLSKVEVEMLVRLVSILLLKFVLLIHIVDVFYKV